MLLNGGIIMESTGFAHNIYLIRRKVLKFIGSSFHIYNEQGGLEFYVNQKGFKLKEAIKVFTDETKTEAVISINARNVIDFSATYDVADSKTGERLGSLRRRGLKSIIRDEWIIFDSNEKEIGSIKEDSTGMALLRRILTNLVPQNFVGTINDQPVFTFKQKFNPFILKITLDFSSDINKLMDRRLGIAAGVLLCAIEGRQN
jgi:uncharacterized protein YxjI